MNTELNTFFQTFKSNVPYTFKDVNFSLLDQVLTDLPGLTLNPIPVNSGTIALVFIGELAGKPVGIKMVRNNIQKTMHAMFRHCKILTRIGKYIPGLNLDINEWMDDIKDTFYSQMDFTLEARNAKIFYQKFRKSTNIVIPQIYFAQKEVLVMDWLINYDKSLWRDDDYRAYSQLFQNFMITSYFIKDIYHGDLHTGNLVFLKDHQMHRLVIIDFGMVGHLSVDNQNLIYNIFSINEKGRPNRLQTALSEKNLSKKDYSAAATTSAR